MMTRRDLLATPLALQAAAPTRFELACMTLPYSPFPFARALAGIRAAGFTRVAWGVTHEKRPALALEATPREAAELAKQTREAGLTPVMMFSTVMLEAAGAGAAHKRRVDQAAAAGIPYLLTFGKTSPGQYDAAVAALREVGPHAQQAGVTVLLKQHGGNTATGLDCLKMLREVNHPSVRIGYDAGNVLDYENNDPLPDIAACVSEIRALCLKDHRNTPKDEDCAPGFGEIDHYKLLLPLRRTGLTIPLVFENIFEPLVPRPAAPEGVDQLARRSREYMETVLRGLENHG
jgi:sugar phosphate isomerase/epimerase